jgi:hypothetical protein
MTVHGSKGLEAPLVILPDTVRKSEQRLRGEVVTGDDGKGWWVTPKSASPAIVDRAREAALAAEERERERLLYVAMTRAQTWLVVCGAGDAANAEWHRRIGAGVEALGALPIDTPTGPGHRYQHGAWETCAATDAPRGAAPAAAPAWLTARAPAPPEAPRPLTPSDLGGPKALPGEAAFDEDASLRRGRQVHRLLEHLPAHPQADWPRLAPALLAHGEDAATPGDAAALLDEVARILTSPALAPLFAPQGVPHGHRCRHRRHLRRRGPQVRRSRSSSISGPNGAAPAARSVPALEELWRIRGQGEDREGQRRREPRQPGDAGRARHPALFLFKDGQVVSNKVGAAPKAALESWIKSAAI